MGVLLAGQVIGWQHTHDDAFISFRYAEHLARGAGMTFNPGERVEGASNLLWVVLLAAFDRAGVPAPVAAKALGGLAGLLVPWVMWRIAAGWNLRAAWWPALFLLCGSIPFAFWSVNGLETGFYAFLVTLGLWAGAGDLDARRRWPWGAVCFLLVAFTRPEGVIFALLYLGWMGTACAGGRAPWSGWARGALTIGGGMAALLVWRHAYFGEWLPNTFYAKIADVSALGPGMGGGRYLVRYLTGSPAGIAAAAGLAGASVLAWRARAMLPALGMVWAQMLFVLLVPADWMAEFRFIVPAIPAWSLLTGWAAVRGWERWIAGRLPRIARTWLAGAGVAAWAACSIVSLAALRGRVERDGRGFREEHAVCAAWLKRAAPPGATVALSDSGAIPYLSGLMTVDLLGLTDAFIARHSAGEGAAYVLRVRRPEIIVGAVQELPAAGGGVRRLSPFPVDRAISQLPEFERDYRVVRVFRSAFVHYALYVCFRHDVRPARLE